MLLRLTPRRDEAAALEFEELASQLDAGLSPAQIGGDPGAGDRMLHGLLARRRIDLDPVEVDVLTAAWHAGRAPISLKELARRRELRATFARSVLRALAYPVLLGVGALVTAGIASSIAGGGLFVVVLVSWAVFATLVFLALRGIASGSRAWTSLPLLADWVRDLAALPYLEVLRGLYVAGMPLLQAHPQAVAACPVPGLRGELEQADRALQGGAPLAEALRSTSLDRESWQLIANGEQAGHLEEALGRALQRRRDVGARRTATLARILGTSVYVFATGVVVYVIFSFYGSYFAAFRR